MEKVVGRGEERVPGKDKGGEGGKTGKKGYLLFLGQNTETFSVVFLYPTMKRNYSGGKGPWRSCSGGSMFCSWLVGQDQSEEESR